MRIDARLITQGCVFLYWIKYKNQFKPKLRSFLKISNLTQMKNHLKIFLHALLSTPLCFSLVTHQASAEPMEYALRTDAILISDMTQDAVYITQDLNHNNNAQDPGEASIYFDANNLSGLIDPTKSVFSIFQSQTGHVYIADGGSDSVYRLSDNNADGDAQDINEANIWFSEANEGGLTLPTPNSIYEADDNALYIVNAGTGSRPNDAIYRTVDLNADGDANDIGEASVWLDLSTLASETLGAGIPDNKSSAFDITFIGNVAYIADLVGGEADTIFRASDTNNNGYIDANELTIFIDDNNAFNVPVATGLVSDDFGALYTLESASSKDQSLYRLFDINNNGIIDGPLETLEIWNESSMSSLGVELGHAFGLAMGPEGEITFVSAGADNKDNILRLIDLNGDLDFMDAGETLLWNTGNGAHQFVDFARTAEYIKITAPVPASVPEPPILFFFISSLAGYLLRQKRHS